MRIKFTFLTIILLIAGCSSPGTLVSRQVEQSAPQMGKAPTAGMYGLFIAGDSQDLYELPLKAGEPLGFEWAEEGMVHWIYAVAGRSRNRLDVTRTYEWRRLP